MDIKEKDHNFRASPRADSFIAVSDDSMDADDVQSPAPVEDEAVIKCVCGFGKGYDDDDAIICDNCRTWQHTLCYFYQRPLPSDDEQYLCLDCGGARDDLDINAAAVRMRRKIRTLATIADRISELSCEIVARNEELDKLGCELSCVESDIYLKGPLLAEHGTAASWAVLDEWHEEYSLLRYEIDKTIAERDAIRARVDELEDDANRVKRNEPTKAEELKSRLDDEAAGPKLWTTACSLGNRAAVPHSLPPILERALGRSTKKKRKAGRLR
ncbi:uncharacterized protein PV09_01393 [Verruconis gallopava]|uniref:Zinc finger PHD-type domain-containing protein n=1 Tax=Verruconis gallopava TaxID=253628 RepID=A0A0D2APB8_9PEZI|nr:uncharacterized protein PV09_01393 [Verruconis gallopava]KIW08498.1 hypothetical protein PV09_01393 [Verruconis gallopava]